ncbi:MAG TPA: hypothetical protein VIA18_21810, partial [Polyangia bacterium]|nr:hypothetical protein [Polyangia bacterium]
MLRCALVLAFLSIAAVARAEPPHALCVDGWCWDAPRPHGRDLRAVLPFAADDVWAAGDRLLVHFDGKAWTGATFTDQPRFFGLWGARRDDVWAVGTELVHWDGKTWSSIAKLADTAFYGVWGSAGDDVWAVGQQGVVLRWNGKTWTRITTGGPNVTWRGVSGSGRNDVWIVGDHGEALHWDGAKWQTVHVEADSAGEPPRLYGVVARARDDVWAAGLPEAVFHFDGKRWQRTRGKPTPKGGDLDNQPGEYLTAIWADDSDICVVSAGPDYRVECLAGDDSWLDQATAKFPLAAIHGDWAVGNDGTVLQRGDRGWIEKTQQPLMAMTAMLQDGDLPFAAVGEAHCLAERGKDGWHVMRVESPTLLAVDGRFEDYWAVGQDGATLHFDGKRWSTGTTTTSEILNGVFWRARNDVWAVGMHGAAQHWNGRAWASIAVPTQAGLSGA